MKILWICNSPLPEIRDQVGRKWRTESWLIGISNQLRRKDGIELHYAFPQNMWKRTINRTINGIVFWGFYDVHKKRYQVNEDSIHHFRDLLKKIMPDIIHIFGTEFPHALECVKAAADPGRVVVSIQGLTSEIAKVYLDQIPLRDRLAGRVVRGEYSCLLLEKYEFYKRGQNERKVLSSVGHVIGRTDWDRKCVLSVNRRCRYHYCSETLRDTFYEGKWDMNCIRRNSIFVSQAHYPIKGLHILIGALPVIKERFPDVKVYVAGDRDFLADGS